MVSDAGRGRRPDERWQTTRARSMDATTAGGHSIGGTLPRGTWTRPLQVLVFVRRHLGHHASCSGIFVFVTREGLGFVVRDRFDAGGVLRRRRRGDRPRTATRPTASLALIAGTASVTGLAMLVVSVPFSLGAADLHRRVRDAVGRARSLKVLVELLAAIPSVVWGFIGLGDHESLHHRHSSTCRSGSACSTRGSHPRADGGADHDHHRRGCAQGGARHLPRGRRSARGATRWQVVTTRVVLPAAKNGLTAAVLLGVGRGFGETMAVLMASGHCGATCPRACSTRCVR